MRGGTTAAAWALVVASCASGPWLYRAIHLAR